MEYVAMVLVMAAGVFIGMTGYVALMFALMGTKKGMMWITKFSIKCAVNTQKCIEEMENESEEEDEED